MVGSMNTNQEVISQANTGELDPFMGSEPVSTDSCRKASPDSATAEAHGRPQRTVLMYAQPSVHQTQVQGDNTTLSPPILCFVLSAPLGP